MASDGSVPSVTWRTPPPAVTLPRGEVHVWRARLDHEPRCAAELRALLTPDERGRADRFRFDRDRTRFVASRAVLRMILGRYLDCEPGTLTFCYGAKGKPALADGGPLDLRFNMSHSHGLALYGVGRGRDVGIDLERIDPRLAAGVADQAFSDREAALWRALPAARRAEAFFTGWTRKEAFAKALGDGLSLSLRALEVPLGGPAALLRTDQDPQARTWRLLALSAWRGYAAAVVASGLDWELSCWHWAPSCGCPAVGVVEEG